MNKNMEQLLAEKAKIESRLKQEKHKEERLSNRITYYENGNRKKRNHRLITRGAAVESIMPETKILSEVEFYSMIEQIFSIQDISNTVSLCIANHKTNNESEEN